MYTFMSRSWNKVVTIFLITIFEISGRKLILVIERNLIHEQQGIHMMAHFAIIFFNHEDIYTPHNEVVGGYTGFTMSVRLYVVCRQILCHTITWVVFLRIFLKFYQLFTGEEKRIPFIFDDFHFCRSRVIGLDMTENRIFTLCRMITWVVFLRMFWNFISSLLVKRGGSLSFLTIFTFAVPELLDLIWRKIGFLPYMYVVW